MRAAGCVLLLAACVCVVAALNPADFRRKVGLSASNLGAAAAQSGRYFGTAIATYHYNDNAYTSIWDREFNSVTAENEMKWETIEPNRNQFNFGPGDNIVQHAQQRGMKVRGHTLVWHAQLANWVKNLDAASLTDAVKNHITTIVSHYKGKIFAWDVVNEAFNEDGSLRWDEDPFLQKMGNTYIEQAFRWARAADPSALLCYNDYNMEWSQGKVNGVLKMVADFKARGVPIDCVGFQGHVGAGGYLDNGLANTLRRFTALGITVQITELDVSGSGQNQANTYASIARQCMDVAGCTGITVWGIMDKYSWHPNESPLLFDNNGNPKQAYTATLNQLNSGSGVPASGGSSQCGVAVENSQLNLGCPSGPITGVAFASYGTPSGSCSAGFAPSTCHSNSSLSVVQNACVGKSSCSVSAANSVFGDPCSGIQKSLAASVICGACSEAAENGALTLTCAVGSISSVSFASYGTPNGGCASGYTVNSACNSATSLSVVQSACVGKKSCTVQATNAVFGDPCSGTIKKLAVSAVCA